jgi:replicative DNA helicase
METQLSFVIIDYLQLMESLNKQNTRHHEISHISREISRLAKRLDVPILLISQLGKEIEKRPKRRPRLSDLKESGDIRNDAHNVIFIYRESEETSRTEILCSKGKDMGTWADHVEFNRFIMKFSDCEEPYQPEREEDFDL